MQTKKFSQSQEWDPGHPEIFALLRHSSTISFSSINLSHHALVRPGLIQNLLRLYGLYRWGRPTSEARWIWFVKSKERMRFWLLPMKIFRRLNNGIFSCKQASKQSDLTKVIPSEELLCCPCWTEIVTLTFSKTSVFGVRTRTRKRRFQKIPPWRAFSVGENAGYAWTVSENG